MRFERKNHIIFFLFFLAASASALAAKPKNAKGLPAKTEAQKFEEAKASEVKTVDTVAAAGSEAMATASESKSTAALVDTAVVPTESVTLEPVKLETVSATSTSSTASTATVSDKSSKPEPLSTISTKAKSESSSVAVAQGASSAASSSASAVAAAKVSESSPVSTASAPSQTLWNSSRTWYNQSLGFLYSRWDKIDGGLHRGSMFTGALVSQEVLPSVEWGVGMNWIRGINSNGASDDIRSGFELRGAGKYKFSEGAFTPFLSLDISYGSYRAWKAVSSSANLVTLQKSGGGTLLGLTPGVGFMGRLYGSTRAELGLQYSYYFGKARNVGGIAAVGAIGIAF